MSTAEQTTVVPAGTWALDPVHSGVGFAITHSTVMTFKGEFGDFGPIGETLDVDRSGVLPAKFDQVAGGGGNGASPRPGVRLAVLHLQARLSR